MERFRNGLTIKKANEPNRLLYDDIERNIAKVAFEADESNRRQVWVVSSYSGVIWKVDLSKLIHIYKKRKVNIVLEPCTMFGDLDFLKIIYTHKSKSFENFNKGHFY